MISHRNRALAVGVPAAILVTVLIASPGFAVGTITLSTPVSGSAISGLAVVDGTVGGDDSATVTLGLAPQTLGDCGVVLVQQQVAAIDSQFRASLPTDGIPDGEYCLIAIAHDGRMSTVVGDISVNNVLSSGEVLSGMQLPTESLGDGGGSESGDVPITAADAPIAPSTMLGTTALSLTGALAVLVLGLGLWARRRSVT